MSEVAEAPVEEPVLLNVPVPEPKMVQEELLPEPRPNDENFFIPPPIAKVDPTGRPSHVTFIVPEYLEKGMLPKPLEQFETMIAAALAYMFPCRVQKWRRRVPRHGDGAVNMGEASQDPNARIRNAANGWLICWESLQLGTINPETESRAREHRRELEYWARELAELMPALLAYEVAVKKFMGAATERIVD